MNTTTPIQRSRGFTFVEVMVVLSISAGMFSFALGGFNSSYGLVRDTRVKTRAESELRRNLTRLSNVIRAADINSLSGFDKDGVSTTSISFGRVLGADLLGRVLGPSETLEWVADAASVDGVQAPGAIYLNVGGKRELVARNVARQGFRFVQQGSTVLVELSTYYRSRDGVTDVASGVAAVSLRNRE